jgi:hypothetical protein
MPLVTVEQQRVSKIPFGAGETTQPMVLPPWASEVRVVHTGSVTVQFSDFAPELAFPRAQTDGPLVLFTGNDIVRFDGPETPAAVDQSVEFIDPALGGVSAPTIRLVGGETWTATYGVMVGDIINVETIGKYGSGVFNVNNSVVGGKYQVTGLPAASDAEVLPLEDQSFGFTTVSGITTSFKFNTVAPVAWVSEGYAADWVIEEDYEAAFKRVRDTNGKKNDHIKNERSANDLAGRIVVSESANVLELDGAAFVAEVGFSLKRINALLPVADNTPVDGSFSPWGAGAVTTFTQEAIPAGLTLVRAVSTTGVGTLEIVGVDDI